MRTRHRIPSVFNISMVDVLCCALGCVILLWLLNLREARDRAAVAGQANQELEKTKAELAQAKGYLDEAQRDKGALGSELDRTKATLAAAQRDKSAVDKQLQVAEAGLRRIQGFLDETRTDRDRLTGLLTLAEKERDQTRKSLNTAQQQIIVLNVD